MAGRLEQAEERSFGGRQSLLEVYRWADCAGEARPWRILSSTRGEAEAERFEVPEWLESRHRSGFSGGFLGSTTSASINCSTAWVAPHTPPHLTWRFITPHHYITLH